MFVMSLFLYTFLYFYGLIYFSCLSHYFHLIIPEEDYLGLYNYSAKRARLINDGSNDDYDMDPSFFLKEYYSFEDLCTVDVAIDENFSAQSENWGLLNYRILGRIFYFLRDDTKSLLFSAATCKHWKRVVGFYKGISKYVDFSSAGPNLCDNMFQNIMVDL